jgi:hypothetical protein
MQSRLELAGALVTIDLRERTALVFYGWVIAPAGRDHNVIYQRGFGC